MELQIIPMTEGHLPSMMRIQSMCYTEVDPESTQCLAAKLRASPGTCFVALASGTLVGYLIALPWSRHSVPLLNDERCVLPQLPDCLYLHDIAVDPSTRSFGVGSALVERFFDTLRSLGVPHATLIAVQGTAPYWRRKEFKERPVDGDLARSLRYYGESVIFMEHLASDTK